MLRLECHGGGYYWISFDGSRVLRGQRISLADKLQPKFTDAMERAGRQLRKAIGAVPGKKSPARKRG